MQLLLLLAAGAALLYALKPKEVSSALASLKASHPNWPRQNVPAMQTGKHYFFAFPDNKIAAVGLQIAQVKIALTAMGWQSVQTFPDNLKGAPSPHPETWAASPGLRLTGVWGGSPGQMFDMAPLKPLGITTLVLWAPTEDFVSMQGTPK